MAKIRKDLVGVAMAVSATGEPIILHAGDKVPDGIEVGEHVLAKKDSGSGSGKDTGNDDSGGSSNALTVPPLVGKGSGAVDWRAYGIEAAKAAGLQIEIPEDAKRGDIIEALQGAGIATE